MGGVPQADSAEAELAEVSPRPAALAAAVVAARLELRLAALPHPLRCLRHLAFLVRSFFRFALGLTSALALGRSLGALLAFLALLGPLGLGVGLGVLLLELLE